MPRLIWSPPALLDVARLHRFLNRESRDAASRAVRAVRLGVGVLAGHPEIGRTIDDMPPEFRDWLVEFGESGYIVRYRYDGRDVVVLAVRHAREAGF